VQAGRISSLALMLSGVAGVVMPNRVATMLELTSSTPRGVAETRAGLGGTYAALGGWALASSAPAAQRAVGVTWLGAAAARLGALKLDRPRPDWTFWAFLAAEIGLGAAALSAARK
jgi:cytosine/uracil/thiamine/allantoin permease